MTIAARMTQIIKPPTSNESTVSVYTTARAVSRGPSVLSHGLTAILLARGMIHQSTAMFESRATGGFPPWEGGREIRRNCSL